MRAVFGHVPEGRGEVAPRRQPAPVEIAQAHRVAPLRDEARDAPQIGVRVIEGGRVYDDAIRHLHESLEELVVVVRHVLPPEERRYVGHEQRLDGARGRLDRRSAGLNRHLLAADLPAAFQPLTTARRCFRVEARLAFAIRPQHDDAARRLRRHLFEQRLKLTPILAARREDDEVRHAHARQARLAPPRALAPRGGELPLKPRDIDAARAANVGLFSCLHLSDSLES